MGDRANVRVTGADGSVYLFTHWGGSELDKDVQLALAKRQRWDDTTYLRRVIFCEMITGHEADTTGFGISPVMDDNEHPIIVVNTITKTVGLAAQETPDVLFHEVTFEAFVKDHRDLAYANFNRHGKPYTGVQ